MSFRSILAESAHLLLDQESRIRAEDVVAEVKSREPDLFAAESGRLAVEAASRIVKDLLRSLSEDDHTDDQTSLPGLVLPTAIAVEDEAGNFYYVKALQANRDELRAGRAQRVANVARAQRRLDQYDESLDLLLPVMTDDAMTVEDAVRQLAVVQP